MLFQLLLCNLLTALFPGCLLYTSDAADERSSVDLGGRRIIKKKNRSVPDVRPSDYKNKKLVNYHINRGVYAIRDE